MIHVEKLTKEFPLTKGLSILRSAFFHQGIPSYKALDNICFDVVKGEVIGLIGSNGAGKSTLLKILCGVALPSAGDFYLNGKVVAILELSTGFNEHFTGRENIRRRLSLHGYSLKDINRMEPEIIEFSELSDVIDEKVLSYSSGMSAKLAFSIVTSLDADIFLIDEILSVGDEHFQNKCFRKIKEICTSGRTVVIASHNIAFIERLCTRVIWIDQGKKVMDGPTHRVVMEYYRRNGDDLVDPNRRECGIINDVQIKLDGEDIVIQSIIQRLKITPDLHLQIAIHDNDRGILSHLLNTAKDGYPPIPSGIGSVRIITRVRRNAGLKNGLLGIALVRGSGDMPGSIIEDSWGWNNGKQQYFKISGVTDSTNYIGISMGWMQCM